MSKKSLLPQVRKHIMVYQEDWEWLERHYGKGSPHEALGIGGVIKTVIHRFVTRNKDGQVQALDTQPVAELQETSPTTKHIGV